jgi:hypothetical protein
LCTASPPPKNQSMLCKYVYDSWNLKIYLSAERRLRWPGCGVCTQHTDKNNGGMGDDPYRCIHPNGVHILPRMVSLADQAIG